MRDYLERWVTSPAWGPQYLHVNRPLNKKLYGQVGYHTLAGYLTYLGKQALRA